MKILFVSEYFPPKVMGGGEINLSLLVKSLAKERVDVSVITSYHPGLKQFEIVNGVKIYRKLKTSNSTSGVIPNFKRSLLFPSSVEKEVKKLQSKEKFTHIHFMGTSIIAGSKLRELKIPLLATIESYATLCPKGDRIYHGKKECRIVCSLGQFSHCQQKSSEIGKTENKWYLKYNPFFILYVYNYYKKLNSSLKYCKLISISEYMQKVLQQHGQESVVIPNAINLKDFQNKARTQRYGKPRILYLGSLTHFKGPQLLLKSIQGIDCHCDLYGEGPLKNELEKIITARRLDAQIRPPVDYEKVPPLYVNTDLVVFPSLWPEPFGRVAVEAMATGKPVIGSAIGGITETITKGAGMLFEPNNMDDLRAKIKEIIENKNLCQRLANGGAEKAKRYGERTVIKQLLEQYKNLN